jgi:hypothetical protein
MKPITAMAFCTKSHLAVEARAGDAQGQEVAEGGEWPT